MFEKISNTRVTKLKLDSGHHLQYIGDEELNVIQKLTHAKGLFSIICFQWV